LEFLENNKRVVSALSLLLVLVLFYFVIWVGIQGAVRYVANAQDS
jgi:hypothetical protein